MTRSDALPTLAVALLAGCTSLEPAAPRPTSISPAIAFATPDVIVEIAGEDFQVAAVQRADRGGSLVDAGYRAWLGATQLDPVMWVDTHRLRARVPAGIPVGTYDLTVEGPYGRGTLAAAYQVIPGTLGTFDLAMSSPLQVAVGEELQVTLQATNTGTWLVAGVVPDVVISGAGAVEPVSVSPAAAQDLDVGQSCTFTLRYRAVQVGAITLQAAVAGTDPRTGQPVRKTMSRDVAVSRPLAIEVIASDPFADGSPFAFVVGYGGQVYIGPNRTGVGIIRMQPDGTQPQSIALSFPKDVNGGNTSSNNSTAPPYTSIGYTGCSGALCGPDNEDGRGLLASVDFAGASWLVIGGAKLGGDLDYVYMASTATSPLVFWYVDLSAVPLGPATRGFSAALGASGRLYLGFPDNGGSRPYGIVLLTAPPVPPWPGLDASSGSDAKGLDLHDAYDKIYVKAGEATFEAISMVDTISEMGGRIYIFNDIGCLVSKSSTPNSSGDFQACSPPAPTPDYIPSESIHPTKQYDLEPHERAWPAATAWNGRLYAIRNTSTGPQLWSCDPADRAGVDPAVCERTEWRLIAAEGTLRARFGNTGATAATLLVATPTHLYVGFDDATTGVHVYRTGVPAPAVASDFSGKDGCVAGTNDPATGRLCEGIGGDGFGLGAALPRIFDAKAIPLGDGYEVVIAAGNGTEPVKIVRIAP